LNLTPKTRYVMIDRIIYWYNFMYYHNSLISFVLGLSIVSMRVGIIVGIVPRRVLMKLILGSMTRIKQRLI
jgi:hypothetical protein